MGQNKLSTVPNPTEELASLLEQLTAFCVSGKFLDQAADSQILADRLSSQEIHLAVLGQMKRGKSSLINALLGVDVLPTGVVPLTSVVTEIRGGTEAFARVHYKSGVTDDISVTAVAEFVTEKQNPGNRKRVLKVTVTLPSSLLVPGLVLIDTPGIGSTHAHNSEATTDYLGKVDAALVIFSADPPITEAEALFLRTIRAEIEILFFVLNKADQVSPAEIHEATAFLRGELLNRFGIPVDRIAVVSARFPSAPVGSDGIRTVDGLREQLREFAVEHRQRTLVRAVAADALVVIERALFALTARERASLLTPPQLAALQKALPKCIADARREQGALKTLMRQAEADLLNDVTADLESLAGTAIIGVRKRLVILGENLKDASGRELGAVLEAFLNEEIHSTFLKWRVQKDASLDAEVKRVESRTWNDAQKVVADLRGKFEGLLPNDSPATHSPTPLAMDARVTYKITPVFFSLDSGLLLLPGFLQRRWVLSKFAGVIESELNRNAGKIRFDYLERLERTFREIQGPVMLEIDEAIGSLMRALTPSRDSDSLSGRMRRLAVQVEELRNPGGVSG